MTASHPVVFVSKDAWLADKTFVLPKIVTVTAPFVELYEAESVGSAGASILNANCS